MKKLIASFIMMSLMAIALPLSVDAQRRCYPRKRTYVSRNYRARNYVNRSYQTRGYTYERPSFYRRHRNFINMGIATGGGALLGGLLGGRRGAGLGALIGLGSGALYTYKLRPKKRRY
jgi:hypothetical protein